MMRSPVNYQHWPLGERQGARTNLCMPLHLEDLGAFDNRSARIVDAIQHRL
jgi:uncharacterized protein (DUF2252 family)